MTKVIGVRFKSSARIYYFDPVEFPVQAGDGVIVETARGQEFGDVVQGITEVEDTMIVAPLKPVIRLASDQDRSMRAQNSGKEDEAFAICQKKIEEHKLDMKLVDVEYSFNGSKVVFYFTADERVDFRELVKDLASQFRTRIELRQIGVRDEAKMLGGLGSCGRPVCCKTFLDDFRPVSIKMAKEQNLSLSPTKISGLCGRLMCCLQYEQAAYEDMKKKMPKVNREILTPDGPGIALENNAISEKTKVRVSLPDGSYDVREYHYTLLAKPGDPLPVPPAPEANGETDAPDLPVPAVPVVQKRSAPASGEESQEGERSGNRRRRRGGRGRSNRPQGEAPAEGTAPARERQEAAQGQPNGPRPPRDNRRRGDKPRPEGQKNPESRRPQQPQKQAAPGSTAPGSAAPAGAQEGQPRPNKPHHRRRNPNRPKQETPQPTPEA